ncbi:hypothetical protein FRC02_010072 [Tulasnella sp. 418]|nr:hypothetical protein FRC02_010072 [Tulasnella sp. 418]
MSSAVVEAHISKAVTQTFGITGSVVVDVLCDVFEASEGFTVVRARKEDVSKITAAVAVYKSQSVIMRVIDSSDTLPGISSIEPKIAGILPLAQAKLDAILVDEE